MLPGLVDSLLDRAGEYFAWVTVVGGAAYKAEMQLVRFYHRHLAPSIGGSHLTLLVGLGAPAAAPAHAVTTLDWASPTLGERGIVAQAPSAAHAEAPMGRIISLCRELDDIVAAFRDRPIGHTTFPYVFLDATYVSSGR
jgi:hypothetical protein